MRRHAGIKRKKSRIKPKHIKEESGGEQEQTNSKTKKRKKVNKE